MRKRTQILEPGYYFNAKLGVLRIVMPDHTVWIMHSFTHQWYATALDCHKPSFFDGFERIGDL